MRKCSIFTIISRESNTERLKRLFCGRKSLTSQIYVWTKTCLIRFPNDNCCTISSLKTALNNVDPDQNVWSGSNLSLSLVTGFCPLSFHCKHTQSFYQTSHFSTHGLIRVYTFSNVQNLFYTAMLKSGLQLSLYLK